MNRNSINSNSEEPQIRKTIRRRMATEILGSVVSSAILGMWLLLFKAFGWFMNWWMYAIFATALASVMAGSLSDLPRSWVDGIPIVGAEIRTPIRSRLNGVVVLISSAIAYVLVKQVEVR